MTGSWTTSMRWPRTDSSRRPLLAPLLVIAVMISAGAPTAASARQDEVPRVRALLVGVGDYPGLPEAYGLEAPEGDVDRLSKALVAAGFPTGAIQRLTTASGRRPTRDAVLDALAREAASAGPGDSVLIYLSGHGTQAPARHPDLEPDGLEELFLMADVDRLDPVSGRLPGAIADFELASAIAAIRARGAQVVLIADTCHAAGVVRSGTDGAARAKAVPPSALGLSRSRFAVRGPSGALPVEGDFLGLFAASPGSLALERRLSFDDADPRPVSVFTFALTEALSDGRRRSWREVFQATVDILTETGPAAVPVASGDLDNAPMGMAPPVLAWFPARHGRGGLTVSAGALEGFEPGVAIALRDRAGRSVGQALISSSTALTAVVEPWPRVSPPLRARLATSSPGVTDVLARLSPFVPTRDEGADLALSAELARGACDTAPSDLRPVGPIDLVRPPPLQHCDVVSIRLANRGREPVDVAVVFLNAEGAATPLRLTPDDQPRLGPGQSVGAAFRVLTRDAAGQAVPHGLEHLVILSATVRGRASFDPRAVLAGATMRSADPDFAARIYPLRTGN